MFEYVLLKQSRFNYIEQMFYYQKRRKKLEIPQKNMCSGVVKTKTGYAFFNKPYSWFIYTPTQKIHPSLNRQNLNKIKQNPIFLIPNHLSYPISSKPTKINHFTHFTPQFSKPHHTKNHTLNHTFFLIYKHFHR